MIHPPGKLIRLANGANPPWSGRWRDGNCPVITSAVGDFVAGGIITLDGFFSNKRNGQLLAPVPVMGGRLAEGYIYQNVVPGFINPVCALADCPAGVQWNGFPEIFHEYTEEFHYSYYVKFDVISAGNEAATWVPGNVYVNGDLVSFDPGAPGYLRRYRRINTPVATVTATQPHLDAVNWESPSNIWEDLQIKMERCLVDVVNANSHSGGNFTTIIFSSDQVLPRGSIIKGRIASNYQGEVHTGGSLAQEFNGANVIKMFGDWILVVGYYKASSIDGKKDGAVFKYFRNERLKEGSFQHIDEEEGNINFNDRRLVGVQPKFFEPRYVVENRFPKGNAGPYQPRSNKMLLPFQKRLTTVMKTYADGLIANDSPESVWFTNSASFETAMTTGKAIQQEQISRTKQRIRVKVRIGDFTNADPIYIFSQNSNGKMSEPFKLRDAQ